LNEKFCREYFKKETDYFIKTDLIYTVSIDRLSLIKLKEGKRSAPVIEQDEFNLLLESFKKYMNL